MSLYNQIKKYTEEGKLVVTRRNLGFHIYNTEYWGFSDTVKKAYTNLVNDNCHYIDSNDFCDNETLLGFYNPDTGEVEAIDRNGDNNHTAKPKPIEIDGVKKGFDPETLTFDGVEIEAGDKIKIINCKNLFKVVRIHTGLIVDINQHVNIRAHMLGLECLNITKHYPQKSELEKLEEELEKLLNKVKNGDFYSGETKSILDRYCELKNQMETLKSNNQ